MYREREVKRRETVAQSNKSLISRIFGSKTSEGKRRAEDSDSDEDSTSMSGIDLETDFAYDTLVFGEGAGVEVEEVKAVHDELDLTFEDILEPVKAGFIAGFRGREEHLKFTLEVPSANDTKMYKE